MPETPTFGRYAEIPYDQMTPEQQEGYRSLIESHLRDIRDNFNRLPSAVDGGTGE